MELDSDVEGELDGAWSLRVPDCLPILPVVFESAGDIDPPVLRPILAPRCKFAAKPRPAFRAFCHLHAYRAAIIDNGRIRHFQKRRWIIRMMSRGMPGRPYLFLQKQKQKQKQKHH